MLRIETRSGTYLVGYQDVAHVPNDAAQDPTRVAQIIEQYGPLLDRKPKDSAFHLTVLTSTACNLACPYCFQNEGPPVDDGVAPRIPVRGLTPPVIEGVAGFVEGRMRATDSSELDILLFGGEPLIEHRRAVELLRALADRAPISTVCVQTNGTLLTVDRAQELWAAGLRNINITFDGPKTAHDGVRYFRDRRGSYERILANMTAVAAVLPEIDWQVRVNVAPGTLDGITELISDLTLTVPPGRTTLYFMPLLDYGLGSGIPPEMADAVVAQCVEAHEIARSSGFVETSYFARDCSFCSTVGGGQGAVVGPDGALYSCWDVAGRSEYAVGNVWGGYASDGDLVHARWQQCGDDVGSRDAGSVQTRLQLELTSRWLERSLQPV